jgi:hypothetical protein
MSALTEAIDAIEPRLCAAGKARAALDPESAADFDAWMIGKEVQRKGRMVKLTDAAMYSALQNLKFRVALQTLGRHRRQQGECGCRP